ncbi:non-ribosomal peptide synthetase [Streptomyces sp. NBC_01477]|uniref:non-ribosomal peptide synthetase n=1 Tax=Streptomyces sp. NBC_01477 TaxID=2976015 RepID=UPI002E37A6C4|nr:non-ribosomal peptide synthetase [Streptomyces sp. NBC_01477]
MTSASDAVTARQTSTTEIRHLDLLLREHGERRPVAPAILAPGLPALTYGALRRQADRTAQALASAGVGRDDRVAVALPGGPDAAVALVTVACAAVVAPLDPAGKAREFDALFADMDITALVVRRGADTLAAAVARAQGRLVIELVPVPGGAAGEFDLVPGTSALPAGHDPATPATPVDSPAGSGADTAFLMHTSGTTGRPKLVPQTHDIVCASARNIAASLALGEQDRCLNVLPLFHGHGLMSPLLATLWAGASVVCPPGFDAAAFPGWLRSFEPTWYTAVPAIHQAVAGTLANRQDAPARPLRFVRSASAPLPARLRDSLERATGAPVIDSYGMTEACSIITSNPLPPAERKPGSVGVSIGNELAVRGEDGKFLAPGETGEIVLRGATVISRYDNNPAADAAAFADGWFGTGDSGHLDEDGYLFITGRIKEIINRGGTKVSPVEVDEELLAHPAIVEAAAFALPHATLGEEVAAAVVVAPGAQATDDDIRDFLAARLAETKIPRRLFRVAEIPRTSTGKIQRTELAAHLVRPQGAPSAAPGTALESTVAGIWCDLLGLEQVTAHDHFFDLGGNSLLIRQVQVRLLEVTGRDVPVVELFAHPTVQALGAYLASAGDLGDPGQELGTAQGNRRLAQQLQQRRQQMDFDI